MHLSTLIRENFFLQYMVIDTDTHNWSVHREREIAECSATEQDIYITPFSQESESSRKGVQIYCKSQRQWIASAKRVSRHNRETVPMNSQHL